MSLTLRTVMVLAFGAALCPGSGCKPARTPTSNTDEPKAKNNPGTGDPDGNAPRAKNAGANDPAGNDPRAKGKGGSGVTYIKDGEGSFRVGDLGRVDLTQGGSRSFEVPIVREGGFASEMKLSLRPPAGVKGITFSPADWQLGPNESRTLVVRPRVGREQTRTITVVVGPKG